MTIGLQTIENATGRTRWHFECGNDGSHTLEQRSSRSSRCGIYQAFVIEYEAQSSGHLIECTAVSADSEAVLDRRQDPKRSGTSRQAALEHSTQSTSSSVKRSLLRGMPLPWAAVKRSATTAHASDSHQRFGIKVFLSADGRQLCRTSAVRDHIAVSRDFRQSLVLYMELSV